MRGGLGFSLPIPGLGPARPQGPMTRTPILPSFAALALLILGGSCSSVWNTSATGPAFAHGVYRLGGSANLNYQNNKFNGTDTDTLGVSADLGRFYSANLELGLRGAYTSADDGTVTTDATALAIFGRWYTESRAASRPWIELGGGTASQDNGTLDVSGSVYFLALGLTHFLNEAVAAEIFARQTVGSYDAGIEADTLDLGIGFSLFW